jgi:hypothetical protein
MASTAYSNHQPSLSDAYFEPANTKKLDSSRGLIVNRFFESRTNQFNKQPQYPESKTKKALRITGYIATFGISYFIRQNKKKKHSSVRSLDSLSTTSPSISSTESLYDDSHPTNIDDEIHQLKTIHQEEIDERDHMILCKINEVTTLIHTHQDEINQRDRTIAELKNQIILLKKAIKVDSVIGPRTEKVHQASQTDDTLSYDGPRNQKVHQTSQTDNTLPDDGPRDEKVHQTSQTDHAIPDAAIYVSKEWHEQKMRDYVQLVNDEHQSFVRAVQQQILIAEHSKEMAERETNNISQLRSENSMLKVDLSVINDIHEAEMAECTRVISDLFNENKTLRADLEAAVDASTKKPRYVYLTYKKPTKTSFMTKVSNYMK